MKIDLYSLFIYWGSLVITLFLAKLYEKTKSPTFIHKLIWALIICFPLALIAGIRFELGGDYLHYKEYFYFAKNKPLSEYLFIKEPGFMFLIFIISCFTNNDYIFFFIIEYLTLLIMIIPIFKYKKYIGVAEPLLIYYLLYYHSSFNIMRQVLAISIIIFALPYLWEKKYLKYIICNVLAFFVHRTTILCLGFLYTYLFHYFDTNMDKSIIQIEKIDYKYYLKRFLLFTSFWFVPLIISKFVMDILIIFGKVYYYNEDIKVGFGHIIYVLIMFLPYLIIYNKKNNILKQPISILYDILLLYIPISCFTYFVSWTSRLMTYPYISLIFLIPMLSKSKSNNLWEKIAIKLYYIGFCASIYIRDIIILNYNLTFPYKSSFL